MTPIDAQLVFRIYPSIIGRIRGLFAEVFLTTAIFFAGRENIGFITTNNQEPQHPPDA